MAEQLTNAAGTQDWLNATRGMTILSYLPTSGVEGSGETFTNRAFKVALGKVSRRHRGPVGENIRDAVRALRGDKS